jgi:lysophospholipase L1-like esterase
MQLLQQKTKIVLVFIYPSKVELNTINSNRELGYQIILTSCKTQNVPCVDLSQYYQKESVNNLYLDNLHLSAIGQLMLAEILLGFIQSKL